ncbi:MAG: tungsten cofactor oxidoreductase radical SAM maturase [Anaerolineales bacterium]|nr:tungsten cofactor oxidoreductase radical SAM maturase [Anaerolineales bacterium]
MTRLIVGENGQICLPEGCGSGSGLKPGDELILEHYERGLALHYVRPDVERIYLEVNTRCNLNCAMCVRQAWSDPQGMMSWNTFQAVLDSLPAFPNLKRVLIGGFGEPLMHPRIVEMVQQLHNRGLGVTLTTNGLLLKRGMAETLLHAGLDMLIVSLDSQHVQAYHQAGVMADQVLENLHGLYEIIRDRGYSLPALGFEYVVTRSNLADLYKLPDLAKQLGATFIIVTNLLPHTRELEGEILYNRDAPLQLGGGWGVHRAGWVKWGSASLPRMKWGAWRQCSFIKDPSLVVGWDGGVSPCYALMHSYTYYIYGRRKQVTRYVLGNVNEHSLLDIYRREEYVTFRAHVNDFRFPSCVECGMDCTYAQENTDCWGNDPSCADCLWAHDIIRCP